MIGFLLGYLLGSPTITINEQNKQKPLTKAQKQAIKAKIKHDKTCPNITKGGSGFWNETDNIF